MDLQIDIWRSAVKTAKSVAEALYLPRLIAIVLAYYAAIEAVDYFHLVFLVLSLIFTISPTISRKLWALLMIWGEFAFLTVYFWSFDFIWTLLLNFFCTFGYFIESLGIHP